MKILKWISIYVGIIIVTFCIVFSLGKVLSEGWIIYANKEYDYIEIKEKLQKLNLDEFLCRMIYGRLFFVTFYFDIFDSVMNGNKENKLLLRNIINRADEYEDYINSIYDILAQIKKIPRIGWV